jgi:hypothetical protein
MFTSREIFERGYGRRCCLGEIGKRGGGWKCEERVKMQREPESRTKCHMGCLNLKSVVTEGK